MNPSISKRKKAVGARRLVAVVVAVVAVAVAAAGFLAVACGRGCRSRRCVRPPPPHKCVRSRTEVCSARTQL